MLAKKVGMGGWFDGMGTRAWLGHCMHGMPRCSLTNSTTLSSAMASDLLFRVI